ncbi:uridine kinase [Apiospora arundinis]
MNSGMGLAPIIPDHRDGEDTIAKRAHYSPPWADVSIIGVAGSSGSGKTTLSHAIVNNLNLPWVVIMSMDSFYKPLDPESSKKAFRNEYDFDAPEAIDFDELVNCLRDLKAGKRTQIPVYSFEKHARLENSTVIYSPHVLILEGIFALHDPRVLELMDMRIYLLRDVRDRGRDVEGCIKQWFAFVKPNFENYVEPQKNVADIIVPRGIENRVAMSMVTQYIERRLLEKSTRHRAALKSLERGYDSEPLSDRVFVLPQTPQLRGMSTIIQDIDTSSEDFVFYFDRLSCLLLELALNNAQFKEQVIETPQGHSYHGLTGKGGGQRSDCAARWCDSDVRTGEPELHYLKLPKNINEHDTVLVLDAQMSSGGSALMAVQVLVDHGVPQNRIVFATYSAGRVGVHRLTKVFPEVTIVVGSMVPDFEERWVEKRYFRC